jgi:hypothetical protein
VRIRAQVVVERLRHPSNAARYRKKVAASQFDIVDRHQIYDMYGLERDLPRELLRRIENTSTIVAVDGAEYLLPERSSYTVGGEDVSYSQAASHLAGKLDSQFIITGVIRDLGIQYGLLHNIRHIEMEVAIIDGLSGAVVSRHRINESVRGADEMPRGMVFGSAEFLRTDFGRAFDVVLDKLATRIIEDLGVLPFSAKVVKMEGANVYFDAGATSLVAVGDTLMGYQTADRPLYSNSAGNFLGFQETPMATMVVKQVQPQFSMAELESDDITLKPGDIVRFGW